MYMDAFEYAIEYAFKGNSRVLTTFNSRDCHPN